MRKTKIINLFGAPSAGKSTAAAGIFAELKRRGESAELVTEVAKELVWNGQTEDLADQFYVTALQNNRLRRLQGKVDYVVTDSPVILGSVYAQYNYCNVPDFHAFLAHVHGGYDNLDVYLPVAEHLEADGRAHGYSEIPALDAQIKQLLSVISPDHVCATRDNVVEIVLNKIEMAKHVRSICDC